MDEHEKEKYKRIISWFKGKPAAPFKIDIELHRRCNLKCLACSRRADPKYEFINEFSKTVEMPKERWLEIVREAADLDVKEWHMAGGGEPMYLPSLTIPVMNSIKKFGMYGIITTNGTLWDVKNIENTIDIDWDRIHFSIDGPDAETHDYLRDSPGTFQRAVRTIELFNKLKKKKRSDKPMMNINTVLSVKNYKKLPEIVKLANKLEIEYIFVEPLIVYSELGEGLKLSGLQIKEFSNCLKEAIGSALKYGIATNFSQIDKNLDEELIEKSSRMHELVKSDGEAVKSEMGFLTVTCFDPWFHMTIKCDGRTISCDVNSDDVENVRNKSLEEIWFGNYFESLRKKMLNGNLSDYCAQCNPSHITQRRRLRMDIIKILGEKNE